MSAPPKFISTYYCGTPTAATATATAATTKPVAATATAATAATGGAGENEGFPNLGADKAKNEIYWGWGPENATRPQFFSFLNEIYWGWGLAPAPRPQFFSFYPGLLPDSPGSAPFHLPPSIPPPEM